jgi:nucleoporin POM152
VSPFSLLQKQPGEFTITSIAHQQKLCKAAVTDLRFSVHPLPSAQVGHGKRIYQDIHEGMHQLVIKRYQSFKSRNLGDQAEIVFTLIGEPPFTFTYQRSEPSTKKGGKPGKVLETHTVSRVATNEYSVYSALEGLKAPLRVFSHTDGPL